MALLDQYGHPIATQERNDAWANLSTGLGVWGVDKSKAASYLPVWRVLDQELTSLMNGSDLARKVVSKPVEEMFRRGFQIESDDVESSARDDLRDWATEELQVEENLREGMRWGRLYGGCLNYLNVDDGRQPSEPLDEDNIRSFDGIALVDRRYSFVQSQYASMNGPRYGRPEIYLISNAVAGYGWNTPGATSIKKLTPEQLRAQGAMVTLVHESRIIRFDGLPADVVTRQNLAGWSWSVLQNVYDTLRQLDGAFDSAAYLLQDASQGVLKLKGLFKQLTSGNRGLLAQRLQLLESSRSVLRSIALDAESGEEFTRVATPLAGIADILERIMARFSAGVDIPQTVLFGRSPAGMNATGQSDLQIWYDDLGSRQENELGPKIKRVYRLLAKAGNSPLKGKAKDVAWKVKFRPLYSPTDGELATTRLTNAQRDQIYVEQGVVKPEEIAVDLTDVYPNLDVDAREEALKAGLRFDPYETEPAPTSAAGVNAPGQGEPLSPKAPVPLMGINPATPPVAGAPPAAQPAAKPSKKPGGRSDDAGATVNLPAAAICIVWSKTGELLCVSRPEPPHEMAIPGGHVEEGETFEQAAARELLEETGIEALKLRDDGKLNVHPNAQVVRVFTALEWRGTPSAVEPRSSVAWLYPDALFKQSALYRRAITEMQGKGLLSASTGMSLTRSNDSKDRLLRCDAAQALLEPVLVTRADAAIVKAVFGALLEDYRDALLRQDDDKDVARKVYLQLAEDYPTRMLGWVLSGHWDGPLEIPTNDIDSSNRAKWTASHDGRMPSFIEKIGQGQRKPAILVRTPTSPKWKIVDGHHRFLGHEANGMPLLAYVAEMRTTMGPWDTLHDSQRKGKSGPSNAGPSWRKLMDPSYSPDPSLLDPSRLDPSGDSGAP